MKKRIFTQEEIDKVIYNYTVLNMGQKKAGAEFHMNDAMVKRLLVENGIHIKTIQETNKTRYNIDESFFEIDNLTSEAAYVIGLLAADGCVSSNENCIMIELIDTDSQILFDINRVLKNERPVKFYQRTDKSNNCKIYFYSKKIKDDLAFYDIVPRKTYKKGSNFVENIPTIFFPDFLRGFFDGDGCITKAKGSIKWQLDGSSENTFQTIQKILLEKYNIMTQLVLQDDKRSTIPKYRLYCYSQERCLKIFNLMYTNSSLKLNRKYEKFISLLK